MDFSPDPNKQTTEVNFSLKRNPFNHPPVATVPFQNILGLFLDEKLTLCNHLNNKKIYIPHKFIFPLRYQ